MRLFLLPISTRRTLIYCERVQQAVSGAKPPILDRITTKAATTWAQWERAEKGWQKKLTEYGNRAFARLPYEEWGLKTLPPLTKKGAEDVREGKVKMEVLFPRSFAKEDGVLGVLRTLATERQALHRKRMWWSVALMPISAPFTLVPVIPNIPFFYLCFRAWSHYRALYGGRFLEHLVAENHVRLNPSKTLDEMYTAGLLHPSREHSRAAEAPSSEQTAQVVRTVESQTNGDKEEVMVLQRWNGKLLAEAFELPEMEAEIERAVEQVEKNIKAKKELVEEKKELEQQAQSRPEAVKQEPRR